MIFRRALATLFVVAALTACLGSMTVAIGYALFAFLRPALGEAGAAAGMALIVAAVLGAGALVGVLVLRPPRRPRSPPSAAASRGAAPPVVHQLLTLIRDRPIVAVAAGLVTAVVAARDPEYIGAALRGFINGRPPKR